MKHLLLLAAIAGCGATSAPRPAVSALAVTPPGALLLVGESLQFHAQVQDAAGDPLTDRLVTWQSSDVLIATVSTAGLVQALKPGRVGITATCEGQTAQAVIDSKAGALIGPAGGTVIVLGGALVLKVPAGALAAPTRVYADALNGLPAGPGFLVPGTGFEIGPPNRPFLKPASLAIRYGSGVVPAPLATSVAMYSLDGASWDPINGSLLDLNNLTVTAELDGTGTYALRAPGPVASVTVMPSNVLVLLGTTWPLTAELRDDAGALILNRAIAWSSADTLIARVSQQGAVSGVGIGMTRISASSGGATGSSPITVSAP
jgi:uncharacterized protein YjdB